jgi:hypothetical protein
VGRIVDIPVQLRLSQLGLEQEFLWCSLPVNVLKRLEEHNIIFQHPITS